MRSRPFFKPGEAVRARNAYGQWNDAVTLSGVEGTHAGRRKIHDFPVVWLDTTGEGGRTPWPVEDVRHVDPACQCGCRDLGQEGVRSDG